jgi:hypothetical protein
MPRSILAIGGGAFAALVTMAAPADAAFEVFIDDVTGTWTNVDPNAVTTSPDGSTISWGDPAGSDQSSYVFDGIAPPTQPTGTTGFAVDTPFTIGTFTHNNFPVFDDGSILETATLEVSVDARVVDVDGSTPTLNIFDLVASYNFEHDETPNSVFPDDDPANDDIVSATLNAASSETFEFEGLIYTFALSGFLDDGALLDEFSTTEGLPNSADLQAQVSVVPLPAALPLMLGGLGAVYGVARRRRAAAAG